MLTTNTTYNSPETKEQLVERLFKEGKITFNEIFTLMKTETFQESYPPPGWNGSWPIYPNPNGPYWDVTPYLTPNGTGVRFDSSSQNPLTIHSY